mmetsp:Transcript_19015/g.40958  ORF Transcript_19015/g.40958 Transcript_19015/m.40958 type:complete len:906 (+) Transcript_19015:72-2789(+)
MGDEARDDVGSLTSEPLEMSRLSGMPLSLAGRLPASHGAMSAGATLGSSAISMASSQYETDSLVSEPVSEAVHERAPDVLPPGAGGSGVWSRSVSNAGVNPAAPQMSSDVLGDEVAAARDAAAPLAHEPPPRTAHAPDAKPDGNKALAAAAVTGSATAMAATRAADQTPGLHATTAHESAPVTSRAPPSAVTDSSNPPSREEQQGVSRGAAVTAAVVAVAAGAAAGATAAAAAFAPAQGSAVAARAVPPPQPQAAAVPSASQVEPQVQQLVPEAPMQHQGITAARALAVVAPGPGTESIPQPHTLPEQQSAAAAGPQQQQATGVGGAMQGPPPPQQQQQQQAPMSGMPPQDSQQHPPPAAQSLAALSGACQAQPDDVPELVTWLQTMRSEAAALGVGMREHTLAALAVRSLGPPQPPNAPGTREDWARAALVASAAVLGLPQPSAANPDDISRAQNLAPFLRNWALSPTGPLGAAPPAVAGPTSIGSAGAAAVAGAAVAGAAAAVAAATAAVVGPGPGPGASPMPRAGPPHGAMMAPGVQDMRQLSLPPGVRPMMAGPPGVRPGMMPLGPRPAAPPPRPVVFLNGLLYLEGKDAVGRPVIVVNTSAPMPEERQRDEVLDELLRILEPTVSQPYVLVVVSIALGPVVETVPASWALGAYKRLAKPFRKNVKHILVVAPSAWAKLLLFLSRPFVSSKAADKIKKVESITDIGAATNGEVDVSHLGNAFLEFLQTGRVPPPLPRGMPSVRGPPPPGIRPPAPGMPPGPQGAAPRGPPRPFGVAPPLGSLPPGMSPPSGSMPPGMALPPGMILPPGMSARPPGGPPPGQMFPGMMRPQGFPPAYQGTAPGPNPGTPPPPYPGPPPPYPGAPQGLNPGPPPPYHGPAAPLMRREALPPPPPYPGPPGSSS